MAAEPLKIGLSWITSAELKVIKEGDFSFFAAAIDPYLEASFWPTGSNKEANEFIKVDPKAGSSRRGASLVLFRFENPAL